MASTAEKKEGREGENKGERAHGSFYSIKEGRANRLPIWREEEEEGRRESTDCTQISLEKRTKECLLYFLIREEEEKKSF